MQPSVSNREHDETNKWECVFEVWITSDDIHELRKMMYSIYVNMAIKGKISMLLIITSSNMIIMKSIKFDYGFEPHELIGTLFFRNWTFKSYFVAGGMRTECGVWMHQQCRNAFHMCQSQLQGIGSASITPGILAFIPETIYNRHQV